MLAGAGLSLGHARKEPRPPAALAAPQRDGAVLSRVSRWWKASATYTPVRGNPGRCVGQDLGLENFNKEPEANLKASLPIR